MEPMTDDERNENNLRNLAKTGSVTLSAALQECDAKAAAWAVAEAATWAIAELERLRAELAAVTADRDKLHAELMQQTPTLHWLREQFGEPDEETSTVSVFSRSVFWWHMDHNCTHEYGPELETRAAVLAAVATTSEEK